MSTLAHDAYRTARQLTEDVSLMRAWERRFALELNWRDEDDDRLYEAMCRARFALQDKAAATQRLAAELYDVGL
jgi:hypothetical protein